MINAIKYYEQGTSIRLIETDNENLPIDIFEKDGTPADLTGARAFFHLMEFSTRNNIWSKECFPVNDPNGGFPNITYPYTVFVNLSSSDTLNLEGHYTGQLELIDYNNTSKFPFQIEIIIAKNAK
jgi:hypothetical protein